MNKRSRIFLLSAGFAIGGSVAPLAADSPTLRAVANLPGANEDQVTSISHANLLAASDAADADADTILFRFKGALSGTLTKDGAPVAVDDTLAPDETWSWTPDANANGTLAAFNIRAFAGGQESSHDVGVNIDVAAVNDAPSFTKGPDVSVNEDSTAYEMAAWATDILVGPANENTQTAEFIVTPDQPELFSAGPALSSDGKLTFTVAADAFGVAEVSVTLKDDGGTDLAGVDESEPQTFQIEILAVNDPPSFTIGSNITINESSPAYTESDWATDIIPGPANESDQAAGLAFVITSNNKPGLFSVAPAVAADGTLTFTLAQYENGTATLKLKLTDTGGGEDESPEVTFTIEVTPVADPPVLAGTVGGTSSSPYSDALVGDTGSPATFTPFDSLTISDPDDNKPNPESLTVTVSVSNDCESYGTFALPGFGISYTSTSKVFTLTGATPAAAQSSLRGAKFTLYSNVHPVGLYSFGVEIGVADATLQATPLTSSIHVRSANDAPEASAMLSVAQVPENGEVTPFRLFVHDEDIGDTFSVTVVETTKDAGGNPAPLGTLLFTTNPITGNAATVVNGVAGVRYRPNPQESTKIATFELQVTDVHPDSSTGTMVTATPSLSLTILFSNDPPEFAGITTTLLRTTDDPAADPVYPFSAISIFDPDAAQLLIVTLALDDPAKGSFIGDFNLLDQITGTAAEVTAKLRAVKFEPTTGRLPVGQSETVTITVTVDDGVDPRSNNLTRIEVTAVDGAPVVVWDQGNDNPAGAFPLPSNPAKISPTSVAKPFEKVGITDAGDVVVTVTIDNPAKGELGHLGGFIANPAHEGSYEFTGTSAAATTAIRELEFYPAADYLFPPNQPGRTDFTITASDSVLNLTTRLLPIVLINEARNFMVTRTLDDPTLPGTLRHAVATAADNDVITFALPDYPAVIRLSSLYGPLVLEHHLTFRGPGPDLLTISGDANANNATDTNDVQLFRVFAAVEMHGLRLRRGYAATGGAIYVGRRRPDVAAGALTLRDCILADCLAAQWGGALDVVEGSVDVARCLFENNSLRSSSGLGGGAVSLYTSAESSVSNTTFSGNAQLSPTGYGGGAIYAENFTPNVFSPTRVTHCTFSNNLDSAAKGSSIHSNVANARVVLTNNIFADFSARNLQVAGGSEIDSEGGNLSNDNTTSTTLVGGIPQWITLLNQATDQVATNPRLAPIGPVEGQTRGHRLLPDSPARGGAVPGIAITDQRGVIRNSSADRGAIDAEALGKLVVHEIFAPQISNTTQFIEFYNPRDQAAIDLGDFEVWIDGLRRHVFTGPLIVAPGYGIILADSMITPASPKTPVQIPSEALETPSGPTYDLMLGLRGLIELRAPTSEGARMAESESYVAVFANPAVPTTNFDFNLDSITLAPQFVGEAFVPHSLVKAPPYGGVDPSGVGDATSPGADATSNPFGEDNAFPVAVRDSFEITEDDTPQLDVLANDIDADGSDELVIVDVNPTASATPPATENDTTVTPGGATVVVVPAGSPLRGTALGYDPRTSFNSLPEGAHITDTFAYSIIDVGGGAVGGYADSGAGETIVTAPSNRLTVGQTVRISGSAVDDYNTDHVISAVDEVSFTIPVDFSGNPGVLDRGRWQAALPRDSTRRDEAVVEVSILGRNDAPTPLADTVTTDETTILRIFGDPDNAVTGASLDTDTLYPAPRVAAGLGLLTNDTDPDSDDNPFTRLKVVGVCRAQQITGYAAGPSANSMVVTVPDHGLVTGTSVLISGYGGHPSYNGYHVATVTGNDTFTVPVAFIDDAPQNGMLALLNDNNRFTTISLLGAEVTLELRADRRLNNVVYNPRPSIWLDGMADGEETTDLFYYAVEDSHGAVSIAAVNVHVSGLNDAPFPVADPADLTDLYPLVSAGQTLAGFLADADVLFVQPSAGGTGRVDATIQPGGTTATALIRGIDFTDEDSAIDLASDGLLSNDSEIDRSDSLRIELAAGQGLSRMGAAVTIGEDGTVVTYAPSAAPALQALAREERVIDTFEVTISDGFAQVVSLVALVVEGRNDQPLAAAIGLTTSADQLLVAGPPEFAGACEDIDQNLSLPDNQKFLLPVVAATTTVTGAQVDVLLGRRAGAIDGLLPLSGEPDVTALVSSRHGLQSGEQVFVIASGLPDALYTVTRIDDDTFAVPVAYKPAFATLAGGNWQVLASTFRYDPRRSVFTDTVGEPEFTLQGLAVGQSYSDSFTYSVLDGSYLFANDDIYRIEADRSAIELRVLDNDTSLDEVAISRRIVAVGTPDSGGSVVLNGDQSLIYTPEIGFVGDEVFVYTIEDNLGNRDSAMVTARVTIDRLNGNLRANADCFTVATGQSPLLNVLANDNIIPATGDPLELASISRPPDHGGLAAVENGRVRYTPDAAAIAFPYTETFEYTMSGGGPATAVATVSVLVIDRRGTLNVRADAFSIPAGGGQNILNVLENDNILPGTGEDWVILSSTTPAHGTVVIRNGNSLVYTPPAAFLGSDSFTYTAVDGFGGTGTATVAVKVGYLTTNTDIFSVPFDDPAKTSDDGATELDVLANDNVVQSGDGQVSITAVAAGDSAFGEMTITPGGGSLSFDPAESATGQRNYVYTITDAGGRTATGTMTVVVVAAGIRASSDFFTVQTDSEANVLPVLANDIRISDLPGQLSIASIGNGTNAPDHGGSAEISADFKGIIYTPAPGFEGVEWFTYTATDGDSNSTALVSVRSTIGEMTAADDAFLIFRGSADNRLAVLGNDRVIPDGGQLLFITAVGLDAGNLSNPPHRGTLAIIEDGAALRYTPSPDNLAFPYVETFSYEISAGGTARAEAIIRLEVVDRGGARDLETNHDAFSVRSDSAGTLLPVLANDSVLPASAAAWIITEVTAPTALGTAQIVGSNVLYVPQPGFVGSERFTYRVSDGLGGTGFAEVIVRVGDVSVSDDIYSVLAGGGPVALDVTANDGVLRTAFPNTSDPAQADFVLSTGRPVDVAPPEAGTAAVDGNGVVFTPSGMFSGEAVLTYWVEDNSGCMFPGTARLEVLAPGGDRDDAVVTITVNGVNDPPNLVGADLSAAEDTGSSQPFATATLIEYDDQRGQWVRVIITWPSERGVLSGEGFIEVSAGVIEFHGTAAEATAALRTLVFAPFTNRITVGTSEDTRFTVSMDDGFVSSPVVVDSAVTTVTPVNDLPVVAGTVSGQKLYQYSTLRPFAGINITEVDDLGLQALAVTVQIDNPVKGALSNLGGFVEQAPGSGIYVIHGTAAATSDALRALVFEPTPGNRVTPTQPEVANFTITVDDAFGPPVVDGTTSVIILHGEVDRLLALDGTTGLDASQASAAFGNSVAISGDTLLVGSPLRDVPVVDAGRVYVHERHAGFGSPWGQVAILAGADTVAGDRFGSAVAIDGDLLAVGAPLADVAGTIDAGCVYVFHRDPANPNAWLQSVKLAAPAGGLFRGAAFGAAVAIQGNTLLVGAPKGNGTRVPGGGRVFAYRLGIGGPGNWTHAQTLIASDTILNNRKQDEDLFGTSVALDGNTAIAGSPGSNLGRVGDTWSYGASYIFDRAGSDMPWTESKRLDVFDASALASFAGFGSSVDISGDRIVVGIYWNGLPESVDFPAGARVYERDYPTPDQWGLVRTITPKDGGQTEMFGAAVAIAGDLILVGSPGPTKSSTENRGFVEVYRRTPGTTPDWGPIDLFAPGNPALADRFGEAVAIDGFTGVVGAGGDSVNTPGAAAAGSARVYQFLYDLGPRLTMPVPDQFAEVDVPFSFAIDPATFDDPVFPDDLTLGVQLANGNPLPAGSWLSFDSLTGVLSGTPTAANDRDYELVVFATNPLGSRIVSNTFRMTVGDEFKLPDPTLEELYAEWIADFYAPEVLANSALEEPVWGMSADPDGDSCCNVMDMLFGTRPDQFDSAQLRFVEIGESQSTLEFPVSSQLLAGLFSVEWSEDLSTWSNDGVSMVPTEEAGGKIQTHVTIVSTTPRPKLFVRIVMHH